MDTVRTRKQQVQVGRKQEALRMDQGARGVMLLHRAGALVRFDLRLLVSVSVSCFLFLIYSYLSLV